MEKRPILTLPSALKEKRMREADVQVQGNLSQAFKPEAGFHHGVGFLGERRNDEPDYNQQYAAQKNMEVTVSFTNQAAALQKQIDKYPNDVSLHICNINLHMNGGYFVQAEILFDYVSGFDNISEKEKGALDKLERRLRQIKRVHAAPQFGHHVENSRCLSVAGDCPDVDIL